MLIVKIPMRGCDKSTFLQRFQFKTQHPSVGHLEYNESLQGFFYVHNTRYMLFHYFKCMKHIYVVDS